MKKLIPLVAVLAALGASGAAMAENCTANSPQCYREGIPRGVGERMRSEPWAYGGYGASPYGYYGGVPFAYGAVPPYVYQLPNNRGWDRDGDGVANRRDADRDGDGVANRYDRYPSNPRYR